MSAGNRSGVADVSLDGKSNPGGRNRFTRLTAP
jgi:hypothetical protein